jgi:hypothetical protein
MENVMQPVEIIARFLCERAGYEPDEMRLPPLTMAGAVLMEPRTAQDMRPQWHGHIASAKELLRRLDQVSADRL